MYAVVAVAAGSRWAGGRYTYVVPPGMELAPGCAVTVPFGRGGALRRGYVIGLSDDTDIPPGKLKAIERLDSPAPVVSARQSALAEWMSEKYYCQLADCLSVIAPARPERKRRAKAKASARGGPPEIELNPAQAEAVAALTAQLERPERPWLLFGVTGSGKTEVYARVIESALAAGKTAVFMVPEIALTPQTERLLSARFGGDAAVIHSRQTPLERSDVWRRVRDGSARIVVGPRSAVFAPMERPGVIVIDEEHDAAYKSEQDPKYDAREVAEWIGRAAGALVVYGSATPSLDTFERAERGEIGLIELPARANGLPPPAVEIVDMRLETAAGIDSPISRRLAGAMGEALSAGNQIMLFLNRRGHSPFVSCRVCGDVMRCGRCAVNLTYHSDDGTARCHYCGESRPLPKTCPVCGNPHVYTFGWGTQKVEEAVREMFPGAAVLRLDSDAARPKGAYESILRDFRSRSADILIGTQMIAKGHDFPGVSLVGVIAADQALYTGDFRAAEGAFALMTQMTGRAGRAGTGGLSIVQTYSPGHYSVICAARGDYRAFYGQEILIRRRMSYPPFTHIFQIVLSGEDEKAVIGALTTLAHIMGRLDRAGEFELFGPAPALVSKINNNYRWRVMAKAADERRLRIFAMFSIDRLRRFANLNGITIMPSMDPRSIS